MADRITLEDLRPAEGSTGKSKRVGRGRSSGHGKTSCRGHNGEGQRSGRSSKRGFEGGQMPAYRRLPKLKGFQIINARNYAEINVGRLAELDLTEVSLAALKEIRKAIKEAKKTGNPNAANYLDQNESFLAGLAELQDAISTDDGSPEYNDRLLQL